MYDWKRLHHRTAEVTKISREIRKDKLSLLEARGMYVRHSCVRVQASSVTNKSGDFLRPPCKCARERIER